MNNELTIKQKRFADLYLASGNLLQSYKKAYGTKNDGAAGAAATRLLKNVKVKAYIEKERPKIAKKINYSVEWLRDEVLKVIRDENARPADRLKGFEILGKTMGAFVEKRETTINSEDFVIEVVKSEKD